MARILFVVPPFTGHVNPTVAIGAELMRRGHEVAWVGHGKIAHRLPAGARLYELPGAEELPVAPQAALGMADTLASVKFLWDILLPRLTRNMLPGTEAAADEFGPDVIVADLHALAGGLAARRRGLPWATTAPTNGIVDDSLQQVPQIRAWLAGAYKAVQREAGFEPVDRPERSPHLILLFTTQELTGRRDFPAHWRFVGPCFAGRPEDDPFPWEELRDGPRILVTLGTISFDSGKAFLERLFEGLEGLPVQAIVAVPRDYVPDAPANVLVHERVPVLALLERVDAVVCHGGANTVVEALAFGRPLVIAPISYDQPITARFVEEAGAGLRVSFRRSRPADLRAAVQAVLGDPAYREGAERIRRSFEAAGGPAAAADALEGLVR